MLKSIKIASCPVFGPNSQTLEEFAKVNFLYGSNGSGKSTIAKIIGNNNPPGIYEHAWEGQPRVVTYNAEYVRQNFEQKLGGIFTIGQSDIEAQKDLETKTLKRATLLEKLARNNETLNKKNSELQAIENQLQETCWKVKTRYQASFQPAFVGVLRSKEDFKNRVLSETRSNKSTNFTSIETLQERALTVFAEQLTLIERINGFDFSSMRSLNANQLWKEAIVGRDNPMISALIDKLKNADWVQQGMTHVHSAGGKCPFCQQEMPLETKDALEAMYDHTHRAKVAEIGATKGLYQFQCDSLLSHANTIRLSKHPLIEISEFEKALAPLTSVLSKNLLAIDTKISNPALQIALDEIESSIGFYEAFINDINDKVDSHNAIVNDIDTQQSDLKSDIWKTIVSDTLSGAVEIYQDSIKPIDKALASLQKSIEEMTNEEVSLREDITKLVNKAKESGLVVNSINKILKSFGFRSFSLSLSECGNYYKLIRANGNDARATLSEGEKNFVLFLYFYHSIQDNVVTEGITSDKVVVIDDPVCSMDNDVLYIISTLTKRLIEAICKNQSKITQLFINSHNLYFFKEVTYKARETQGDKITFWILRKMENHSLIEKCEKSPVRTGYEMLWQELKHLLNSQTYSLVPNCMRRIVETYFKMFGNQTDSDLFKLFEESDQLLCRTLFSWNNDGSHGIDDAQVVIDERAINDYIRIFESLFTKTKHEGHYNMMGGPRVPSLIDTIQEQNAA